MLKQRIDKATFDGLPDVMKAEYKINPANAAEYVLDAEDAKEALAARDREKLRADGLQAQINAANAAVTEAERVAAEARTQAAREKGDVTALDKSWQTKLDAQKADNDKVIEKANNQLRALLVRAEARRIAAKISTVPDLIEERIAARLTADLTGDIPITRVLDAAGRPSATSIDELEKEFVANPAYATIIKASEGSGGGAGGGGSGGGAPGGKKISQMTEREKVAFSRANPEGYRAQVQAEKQAARGK